MENICYICGNRYNIRELDDMSNNIFLQCNDCIKEKLEEKLEISEEQYKQGLGRHAREFFEEWDKSKESE